MKAKCLLACFVVLLAGTSRVHAEDGVLLRHRFEKDKPLIYRTETSSQQVQTVMDQKIEISTKQTDVTIRTLEKQDDDGNFRFKSENKRLLAKMKMGPVGDFEFDSTSTEREKGSVLGAALTPLYERLSGAALTVTVAPRGKVIEVDGFKELVADLLKDNPLAAQFAGGGSKSAGEAAYQDTFDQFPENPVKPGDTWEVPYEIDLPKIGKADGRRVYKFEGRDKVGDRETVKYTVTIDLSFDINVDVNGAKVTGKMTASNATGTVQFDPAKGELVSKTAKYTISGNLSVEVGGKTIPAQSEQTQTISVELLDKLPE